jgi:hypothetical protein
MESEEESWSRRFSAQNLIQRRLLDLIKNWTIPIDYVELSATSADLLETSLYQYFFRNCLADVNRHDVRIQIYLDLVKQLYHELGKQIPFEDEKSYSEFITEIDQIYNLSPGKTIKSRIDPTQLLVPFNVKSVGTFKQQNVLIQSEIDALSNISLFQVTGYADAEADIICRQCKQKTGRVVHKTERSIDEGQIAKLICSNILCQAEYKL